MSAVWKLEFPASILIGSCGCCEERPVQCTGHVYRDNQPFAVFHALYCNQDTDQELDVLLTVGDWQRPQGTEESTAFHCRVRAIGDSYQVMFDDAADSAWAEDANRATKLTRAQALAHEAKPQVLECLDEAMLGVPSLNGYLQRCQRGDPATPLEPVFDAPDAILEIPPEERESRTHVNQSFASIDEKRYFIRCLLPLPIEHYGRWAPSFWVEITEEENQRVLQSWDSPESYLQLRFEGKVANSLDHWGIMLKRGTQIGLATVTAEESPKVVSASDGQISDQLVTAWSKVDFEKFALIHGLL